VIVLSVYLVTLSSERDSELLIERALHDSEKDSAKLRVVYVVMPADEASLAKLGEQAWVGQALLDEATQELKRTALKVAMARLEEISELARERGIDCSTDILDGNFEVLTQSTASDRHVTRLYVNGRTRGLFSRLFFGSETARVAQGADCEVIVVEDGV